MEKFLKILAIIAIIVTIIIGISYFVYTCFIYDPEKILMIM